MNLTNLIDILANRKLHGRIDFRGLKISIENRAGSVRRGVDKNGKPWATKLTYPYGYLLMTEGTDGDHLDCFVGPNKESNKVFIVHRQDPDTKVYDEDKVLLGFNSAQDAKKAFNDNYDRLGNFGGMTVMSIAQFRVKALATRNNPQKLAVAKEVK